MATSVLSAPSSQALLCGPRGRRAIRAATSACHVLRRHGWTTSLTGFPVAGDTDVRLIAVLPGSAVWVELLCPCPDAPDGAGPWSAVRIGAEERAVWRGPDRSCTVETLVRFVDDLVRRPGEELARCYDCCG